MKQERAAHTRWRPAPHLGITQVNHTLHPPLDQSVECYLVAVSDALSAGKIPPSPRTVGELVAACQRFPGESYYWWPGPDVRASLDLPDRPCDLLDEGVVR